mgnify:CR=1 FL=1
MNAKHRHFRQKLLDLHCAIDRVRARKSVRFFRLGVSAVRYIQKVRQFRDGFRVCQSILQFRFKGGKTDPDEILAEMRKRFPKARIVLTLGKDGAVYSDGVEKVFQSIFPVKAVDTTAAGDTFTGYFLAGLAEGMPIAQALRMSARASAIAVSRPGAVPSIPLRKEVEEALANS